jgi:hypothetical protein
MVVWVTDPIIPEPVDIPTETEPPQFKKPNFKATRGGTDRPTARKSIFGSRQNKAPEFKEPKVKTYGKRGQFEKPLAELYGGIALMIMPFDPICGSAVIDAAPNCAKALDDAAYENEATRKILEALVTTSVAGKVIIAHVPIIMAVMMHHSPGMQARLTNGFGDTVEQMLKNQEPKE